MNETRRHTNQLLQNILPLHVAKYFLEQDRQAEVRTWVELNHIEFKLFRTALSNLFATCDDCPNKRGKWACFKILQNS